MNDEVPTITAAPKPAATRIVEETEASKVIAATNTDRASSIVLPRNNKEYGTKEYWENRFATEESFEWLLSYPQIQHQLAPIFLQYCRRPSATGSTEPQLPAENNETEYDKSLVRILVVGCGNAPFSCHLYDDGYTNIINIDYSRIVIQNMQLLHSIARPKMQWMVMDMTRMDALPDASFDVVIDKAAMDAIMTHEQDVWNPNPTVIQNAYRMCFHISRILQSEGTFVQISLTQPHFRNKYLLHIHDAGISSDDTDDTTTVMTTPVASTNSIASNYCTQFGWTVYSEMAGRSDDTSAGMFGHYLYIMKKGDH